jgi:hypothetical protein
VFGEVGIAGDWFASPSAVQASGSHRRQHCESDQAIKRCDRCRRTQPERDVNWEGRKWAEKGQKMADGTEGVRKFSFDISWLGWLGNLDSNQD